MKNKTDWKKEIKEIFELLGYTAFSAMLVFHMNYVCSRKKEPQPTERTPNAKVINAAADTIAARNSLVRNISGKVR